MDHCNGRVAPRRKGTSGDNRAETLANNREVIESYVEACRDAGDPVPTEAGKEFVEVDAA